MINADDALPAKVLIVDDNEQNVELLQAYLEEIEGTESRIAHDGLEALQAVTQDPPDLILLDIMMPNMSGFEVCKQLKENPTTRHIPIIIVTALNESSDYERGMEAGADDFLTRPFNRIEFIARVRSLLRIREMRRAFKRGESTQEE